jgi:arginine/lysine/ornithine decarboxylase
MSSRPVKKTVNTVKAAVERRRGAELITPYPPGIPAAAPGEVLSAEILDYLEEIVANGAFVEGATDPTLDEVRVVA